MHLLRSYLDILLFLRNQLAFYRMCHKPAVQPGLFGQTCDTFKSCLYEVRHLT